MHSLHEFAEWLLEYASRTGTGRVFIGTPKSSGFMLLKSLFDNREFDRVVNLRTHSDSDDVDQVSLVLLSRILLGQRRSQTVTDAAPKSTSGSPSPILDASLLRINAESVYARYSDDSVITYLYALVLKSAGEPVSIVAELLLKAIRLENYNWAAWVELAGLPVSPTYVVQLQQHELYKFYAMERLKHERKFKQLLALIEGASTLSGWGYIEEARGLCLHELREFDEAVRVYSLMAARDPFRIGGMDIYSNCLFVQEKQAALFHLAEHSEHEKAAVLFKKATCVDPSNVHAWLLLGHELIELRNPSAALSVYQEALSRSTDRDKDSRPWHAIGQLFELINQQAFAVFYYEKAAAIDSADSRIWKALASCYTKINRPEEANKCQSKLMGTLKSTAASL